MLDCLDQTEEDGWEFVVHSKGVRVHRKTLPSIDGRLSRYCCVKVRAPSEKMAVFRDALLKQPTETRYRETPTPTPTPASNPSLDPNSNSSTSTPNQCGLPSQRFADLNPRRDPDRTPHP